jgi:transcriptional regulator with XRE-family HTH domain
MLDVDVGGWVRALRERHGLTQGQLAYRAGTSQQAISRIEAREVSPSISLLDRLAACCGEELLLDARAREVPFDDAQLAEQASMSIAERLQLASSWNRLAGELTGTAAKALADG